MRRKPAVAASSTSPSRKHRTALVLQGGGALGAYQVGVYQAMHENDLTPDWVVGTSIGAINAAIIAGNKREFRIQHLREFWESISHADLVNLQQVPDATRQFATWMTTMDTFARGVPGFFTPRTFSPFAFGLPVPPEEASFYNTDDLRTTLNKYVDFDYLNHKAVGIRLTMSAVKVTCGTLVTFDTNNKLLSADHVMASGGVAARFCAGASMASCTGTAVYIPTRAGSRPQRRTASRYAMYDGGPVACGRSRTAHLRRSADTPERSELCLALAAPYRDLSEAIGVAQAGARTLRASACQPARNQSQSRLSVSGVR